MRKPKSKDRREYIQLHLPCADAAEASTIAGALLGQRLIVCAKRLPVESAYWWQGQIEQGSEELLIMDTAADLFDAVEAEVAQLHSYETFVLQALPLARLSAAAQAWMDENLVAQPKERQKEPKT
jgi:periplasmic divalent cation tolerance protein